MQKADMQFVKAKERKPGISDCDWLGYVLCRVKHGRNYMFADMRIDDPAMTDSDWEWLEGANQGSPCERTTTKAR